MYQILLTKEMDTKVKEVCWWMAKNDIKHHPTTKTLDGWIFSLYTMEDTVAFKLAWNGKLL